MNWCVWIRLDWEYRNFENVDLVISIVIKCEDCWWIVFVGNIVNIFE